MKYKKDQITLFIAGFTIQINLLPSEWIYSKDKLTSEILEYYQGFIINGSNSKSEFTIDVVEQRNFIYQKRKKIGMMELFKEKKRNHLITYYQLSIMQFQLIINDALHFLLMKNSGCILHASACNREGGALLFLGPSGQGKSTIMKLLHGTYPALADDSVILRKMNNTYLVFQTPTREKESWIAKSSLPHELKSIYFLGEKAARFDLTKLTNKGIILKRLLEQVTLRYSSSKKSITFLFTLLKDKDIFYSIQFLKDEKQLLAMLHLKAN